MAPTNFPAATRTYLSSESYYLAKLQDATYTCDAQFDNVDGFVNSMCLDDGVYSESKTVNVSGDIIATCAGLPKAYCNVPVELIDASVIATLTYVDLCYHESGETCSTLNTSDIVHVTSKTDQSDESVKLWYVGDAAYTVGYNFTCTTGDDQFDGYYNILCDNGGSYEDLNVYCSSAAAEKGQVITDSDSVSSCNITECADMPSAWCATDVDIYKVASDAAVYYDTCVSDNGTGCTSKGGNSPAVFHTPKDNIHPDGSKATTSWWYVGSALYDSRTTYTCNQDQDVGDDEAYINVICDSTLSGKLSGDNITCSDPSPENTLKDDLTINCNIVDCTDMGPDMCAKPIDLYIDGEGVNIIGTCILSDDESSCIVKPGTESTTPHPSGALTIGTGILTLFYAFFSLL